MSEALTGTNDGDAPRERIAEVQEDWRLEVQLHSKTYAQLAVIKQERDRLKEALEFYANPDTYFGCGFLFDRPTGGFDSDFDEGHEDYDRPMPGKAARAALRGETGGGWDAKPDEVQ
jgi:hypothetical protein